MEHDLYDLDEAINTLVRTMCLCEMAKDRKELRFFLARNFAACFREFAVYTVFAYNGKSKWVEHKRNKVVGQIQLLLNDVEDASVEYDVRKVVILSLADATKDAERKFIRHAESTFKEYYGVKVQRHMDAGSIKEATDAFRKMVTDRLDFWD